MGLGRKGLHFLVWCCHYHRVQNRESGRIHCAVQVLCRSKYWEKQDKLSDKYKDWKASHEWDANFSGSAWSQKEQYFYSRGPSISKSATRVLIRWGQQKLNYVPTAKRKAVWSRLQLPSYCVGHVQKRMGTALRNLKLQHRGQKLSDGKMIGGDGRLTDSRINSLQNYYGDEIQRNKGDLDAMMKAVQASLLHSNSTDDNLRHHLCPEGEKTWCKWQTKFQVRSSP